MSSTETRLNDYSQNKIPSLEKHWFFARVQYLVRCLIKKKGELSLSRLNWMIFSMYEHLCAFEHYLHRDDPFMLELVSYCRFWVPFDLKAHDDYGDETPTLTKRLHVVFNEYIDCAHTSHTYFYRKLDSDDTYRVYLAMNSKAEVSAVSNYLATSVAEPSKI
jgi:hypothetical protein